jgi:NADH-quinone oxidoreductase subunit L
MNLIVTLIPLFPLLGFLILGLGFRHIPKKMASFIGPGTILISFILSVFVLINIHYFTISPFHHLFTWISFGKFTIPFSFLIDPLSCLMLLIVTGVGFIIHVYSIGYMHEDQGYNRFFAYMNLFVFSMLLLVMGANYVIMFIGWEGVGLCSYLLIGFWFRNQEFNNAAKKAFIMNRIGDLGFLLGMFLLFLTFNSLNYSDIFLQARSYPVGSGVIIAITLLLFLGAVGKSAQIPLYTWLPDAMAGPTPVSALIHAATMVTAGVYMIARSNILYVLAPPTMLVIGITGMATLLLAATIAVYQNDIKKILAYSTISQLGYMFVALSFGAFSAAMFHLTTHAFFKALLFLAAGSIIHALGGEQDIRKMGGLKQSMPKTYWTFLVAALAITGIPPLSGFFSKDEILMHVLLRSVPFWIFATMGVMLTAFYMFRLFYLVFSGKFRGTVDEQHPLHESPSVMTIPLIILALMSVFGGFINIPKIFAGSEGLNAFLAPVFADASVFVRQRYHFTDAYNEILIMAVPLVFSAIMIILAFQRFFVDKKIMDDRSLEENFFSNLVCRRFYVDEIYDFLFVRPILKLSKVFHDLVELKIIDRSVNGIGSFVIRMGNTIRYVQTGHVGFYLFIMVFGIIAILLFNILFLG